MFIKSRKFMAEEVNRNKEPLFYNITPCPETGCDKEHRVAITIYPDATAPLCPKMDNLLDHLRKPFQHAELVIDDRTFFQWWHNAKNIGSFPYKVEKAEKGGKPFIKFNLRATHQQVSNLIKQVNAYNSQDHSCMGSAHQVLSNAHILHVPFPFNQLPVTNSFLLRFHPQVKSVETVGQRAISKRKT